MSPAHFIANPKRGEICVLRVIQGMRLDWKLKAIDEEQVNRGGDRGWQLRVTLLLGLGVRVPTSSERLDDSTAVALARADVRCGRDLSILQAAHRLVDAGAWARLGFRRALVGRHDRSVKPGAVAVVRDLAEDRRVVVVAPAADANVVFRADVGRRAGGRLRDGQSDDDVAQRGESQCCEEDCVAAHGRMCRGVLIPTICVGIVCLLRSGVEVVW
jgi:hypothetical protein